MRSMIKACIAVCGSVSILGCQPADGPQREAPTERKIAQQSQTTGNSMTGAAVDQGGGGSKPALNDASTPMPKGGMTVPPPAEPIGPTPTTQSTGG